MASINEFVAQCTALRKKNDALIREIQTLRTEEHTKRAHLIGHSFLTVENWVDEQTAASASGQVASHGTTVSSSRLHMQRNRLLGLQERFAVLQ